jgi:nitrate reductase alpha subunit
MGGFRRSSWDEANELIAASSLYTAKKHGPDRVIGFSPIPAMSMISYAAGTRFLQLLGGVAMSFYDWYCDLPPASPQVWGEQTDVNESADWYNASYIVLCGSNVPMTRTPDAHFMTEARYRGTKVVVMSPDYNMATKFADAWLVRAARVSLKTGPWTTSCATRSVTIPCCRRLKMSPGSTASPRRPSMR